MSLGTKRPVRKSSVKTATDVRFSDRGYAYAEFGNSKITGLINSFTSSDKPDLKDIPPGVVIYNTTEGRLELSDPSNDQWIPLCCSLSGISGILGLPSDGSYTDGPVLINPSGSIADAIDAINEYLFGSGLIELASHLGTTDGNTNGVLVNPTFTLGRVSTPTSSGSPYYTNSWDNDTNRFLTNIASFNWELTGGQSITDLQGGTLVINFYNGNNILIATETLNPDGSTNNQSSSPNSYIQISNLVTKGSKVEGFIRFVVPINLLLASGSGYLRVEVSHTINSNTYINTPVEFFKDSEGSPTITSQTLSLSSSPLKYLSGIKFATISGGTYPILNFSMVSNNIWRNTYRADPLSVQSASFGIPNYVVNYNSSSVTKNSITPPISPFKWNEDFTYNELKNVTTPDLIIPNASGVSPQIRYNIRDPFNIVVGSLFSPTPPILFNTYGNASTDILELFVDENYRLKETSSGTGYLSSLSGTGRGSDAWDSTESLISHNALQVVNGALIYPQNDWSIYDPGINPDYTPLAAGVGDLVYIRRFRDLNGLGRTNGVLYIPGLTESDRLNENILIEIRVVGSHEVGNPVQGYGNEGTGWLSLNKPYNIVTFAGDDGDGCFVNTGGYSEPYFEFTLGNFSTAYAYNEAIEMRVTFKDPAALTKRITRIEIINWN